MIENSSKRNSCQNMSLLHNLKQQNHTACVASFSVLHCIFHWQWWRHGDVGYLLNQWRACTSTQQLRTAGLSLLLKYILPKLFNGLCPGTFSFVCWYLGYPVTVQIYVTLSWTLGQVKIFFFFLADLIRLLYKVALNFIIKLLNKNNARTV